MKVDLTTNQVVQTIPFGEDVAPKKSYLFWINLRFQISNLRIWGEAPRR